MPAGVGIVEDSNILSVGTPGGRLNGTQEGETSTNNDDMAKEIIGFQKRMESARLYIDSLWDDVDDKLTSRRGRYNIGSRSAGNDDNPLGANIYDGTTTKAINDFCDGWQSQSANAFVTWWLAHFRGKNLRESEQTTRWLDGVHEVISHLMADGNFYQSVNLAYKDGTSHGIATVSGPEWHEDSRKMWCLTRHPREIFITVDFLGRVNRWHRKFVMTGKQLKENFEDNLTKKILKRIERNEFDYWTVIHAVYPREKRDDKSSLRTDLPYASIYVLETEKLVLHEGGYRWIELPDTWRWEADATFAYGINCPAIDAIEDVKSTNMAMRTLLHAAQTAVRPPLIATDTLKGKLHVRPDGVTYVKNLQTDKVTTLQYPTQFGIGVQQINELRQELREKFGATIFDMQAQLAQHVKSVVQANLIQGEKAAKLLPVTSRASAELLVPKINKYYFQAVRQGLIEPPPQEMLMGGQDAIVDIDTVGPVEVAARRFLSQQGFQAFLGMLEVVEKVAPQAGHAIAETIDPDALRKFLTESDDTPQRIFYKKEVLAKIRQMKAQQLQQQQQAQAGQMLADSYHKIKDAPEAGSPGEKLVGGNR